jgi:hypothetical protein
VTGCLLKELSCVVSIHLHEHNLIAIPTIDVDILYIYPTKDFSDLYYFDRNLLRGICLFVYSVLYLTADFEHMFDISVFIDSCYSCEFHFIYFYVFVYDLFVMLEALVRV